jgi:hypothetical protein
VIVVVSTLGLLTSAVLSAVVAESLAPYVIGGVIASCGWWLYVLMMQFSGIGGHQTGIAAEEWTAGELRRLRQMRDGWRTANHIWLEKADVDHVALGPGGFFALETKFRSDWASADLVAIAAQARHGAERLRPRLGPKASTKAWVVMWGPGVRDLYPEPFEVNQVRFCCGVDLVGVLSRLPKVFDDDAVESAYTRLADNSRRRDIAEIAESGSFVRPAIYGVVDGCVVAAAVVATTTVVLAPASVQPAGLWTIVAAVTLAMSAFGLRGRVTNPTLRYFSIAVLATATGLGVIVGAAMALNAL